MSKAKAKETQALATNTDSMFGAFNPAELADYEVAPIVRRLEPGQAVRGILEGEGSPIEMEDPRSGETKSVRTWVIKAGNMRAAIMSGYQLDKELPSLVGKHVVIAMGEQAETRKGQRVNQYIIASK